MNSKDRILTLEAQIADFENRQSVVLRMIDDAEDLKVPSPTQLK